jgi:hypothetical protein
LLKGGNGRPALPYRTGDYLFCFARLALTANFFAATHASHLFERPTVSDRSSSPFLSTNITRKAHVFLSHFRPSIQTTFIARHYIEHRPNGEIIYG